jgi:hypothetical protein
MSDLITDFESYFISLGHVVIGGIHHDTILDIPDTIVAIYEYQGAPNTPQIASVDRSIQIVTRDKSATNAKLKARVLYDALKTDDGILNLTTERWCMIYLRCTPYKMKVDTKDRVYYCFNLGVTTYED